MARLFADCPRGHRKVLLTYGAVKNKAPSGGFMPVWRENRSRWYGDTYGRGRDKGQAVKEAKAIVLDESGRYGGDYCIAIRKTVKPRGKGI